MHYPGTVLCQKRYLLLTDEVFSHHAAPAPVAAAAAATASTQAQVAPTRSLLPKAASQSGLRPPGFTSRVAAGRLAAFGFVRSSSVSSVTSSHSADSAQSDPSRTTHRKFRSLVSSCFWEMCLKLSSSLSLY